MVFRGMTGPDRAMAYTLAAYTGLRASELASLTVESLIFDSDLAMIDLEAGYSKRRRHDLQPIPKWLAEQLAQWIAEKPQDGPQAADMLTSNSDNGRAQAGSLWPRTQWYRKAAEMLRGDLEAAEIP